MDVIANGLALAVSQLLFLYSLVFNLLLLLLEVGLLLEEVGGILFGLYAPASLASEQYLLREHVIYDRTFLNFPISF